MSAIYQDQEFVITEQDLAQVEQELEGRAEEIYVKISEELYLESLLSKWEDEEYTPEQEDMLWDESYRMESDIEEQSENQYL